jgi:pimeloyl-ACP methyl ester carboxylesterase
VSGVRERVVLLGPRKSMVGILAETESAPTTATKPVIVILNAGIIHRAGPSRLYVELARHLATLGHPVLRFDLSGIGDSERRPEPLSPMDAALTDIRETLDTLDSSNQRRPAILLGICSGADQAVVYAGSDPRVVGVVLIDPHIPRSRRYYLRYYGLRVLRLRSWKNVFLGSHPIWGRSRRDCDARDERPNQELIRMLNSDETRSFLERAYNRTVENGNQILAVFTGGLAAQHSYRKQILHALPGVSFGDSMRLEYVKDADHMFQSEQQRGNLRKLIVDWLTATRFPADRAG